MKRTSFLALFFLVACSSSSASPPADQASGGGGQASTGEGGKSDGGGGGAGEGGSAPVFVAELGTAETRRLTIIGTAADGLDVPRDLAFPPDHPDQLWTVNETYSGVVIFTSPGTDAQAADKRVDVYARHFMDKVSSLAFGVENRFATCQESRDTWNDAPQPPDDFMGPTLWLGDLDVFAVIGQTFPYDPSLPEGSHIDMLHESPLCMGIAHDHDNAYWAFDGKNGEVVYYDFMQDHGPGGGDHSDGLARRYEDAVVTRVEEVPGHMALDPASGWLYIADTGTGRVMRLDTKSGAVTGPATNPHNLDGLDEYSVVGGATYEAVVTGLGQPSGIELLHDRLFVTDHATGALVAYDLDGRELARVDTAERVNEFETVGARYL